MYWLAVVCTTLVILGHVQQVAGIACNSFADKKFGPVCPFDCSNCGAVLCRDDDYVCLTGYCAAVNGPAGPQGCAFEDIARGGKKMAQMSTYNDIGPYRASNRLYATNVLSTCTHTNTGVSYPWWRVDFGSKHVVYAVQLYNRIHSTALDRLSFFDIRVGYTDIQTAITAGQKFTGNQLCKTYNQRVPETLTTDVKPYAEILCDQPRQGRYLSIQMNEGNGISRRSGYNNVLTICEISIRGYRVIGSGGTTGNGDCWCWDGNECDMAGVCNSGCKLGRYGEYCHRVVALETPTLSAYSPTTVNVQWKLFNSNQLTFIDSNRGSVPLSYRVQHKSGSGAWQDVTGQGSISGSGANQFRALTLTGLRADTQYQIRSVLVKTYSGKPEIVARSTAVTRCAVPTPVTNIRLTSGCDGVDKASIKVTWQASSSVRCGTRSVEYVVWVKEGPAGSGTFGTHKLQISGYVIRNLKLVTLYTVRVEARNSAFPGLKSLTDTTITTTDGALSAPKNVQLSTSYSTATGTWPNHARISVSWQIPANAGCGIPKYRVKYGLVSTTGETILGLDATSHTLLDLVPYTEYEVTVTIVSGGVTADAQTKTIRTAEGQSSPVTDIQFSATSTTSTTVYWTKPAEPYGIITKYLVTYRRLRYLVSGATTVNCPAGSGQAKTVPVSSGTSVHLTGLESNSRYNIAVVPNTNGGSRAGIGSNLNVDTLSAALPKPRQIRASPLYDKNLPHPNQCKATINWAVDIGNDCMVLQFRVDHTPTNGQKVSSGVLSGVTRSLIISSLKCYTDYKVRVVALKGSAESESEPYEFKTPEGKPGRVSSLTITPSSNSAVLSWSAPIPHGVLSRYQITYRRVRYLATGCPSNDQTKYQTVAAGTTTYTVTGLSSYSEYQFSVTAYTNNNQNRGLTTWQTKQTTTKALPKPSQIQASPQYDGTLPHPNQCKATVNWAVDIGNDCMVLQFRVDYTPTNGQKLSSGELSGDTKSSIISSLKCYTDYEVRVVALSGSVESESEPYDFETPEGKPGRVSSLSITPSSNSAVLSWYAPIPHGVLSQYQITYRRVRYLASCQNTDQTETRIAAAGATKFTVTGLSSYTEYQFSVTAYTNNNHNKGLTTWQTKKTTTKAPPTPTITKIESRYVSTYTYPNTVKITVEWSQPAPGVGECMTITNYVHYRPSGTVLPPIDAVMDSRAYDIPKLVPYTNYEVRIEGRSGQGVRSFTGWKMLRTAEGLSGPVTSLSVSPSGTTVDVRWTAPSHPYGVINSYRVSYSRQSYLAGCNNNPGHTGTADVNPEFRTISGLSSYSRYQVRVAAINGAGPGQESSRVVNTLETVPDPSAAPTRATVSDAQTTSATVRFHDISCKQRRGSFKAYNYQLTDLSYGRSSRSGDVSTIQSSLTGLTPFTSYNIRYNWANQKGASAWSEAVEFVTKRSTPPAPTITTVDSGPRYINVTVKPPYPPYDYLTTVTVTCRRTDNNPEITNQITNIDNSKEAVVVSFDEVQPSTDYFCAAVVSSLSRSSIESEEIQVSTEESEATEPCEFKAVEITNSSMRLTWTSPEAKNGLILRYQYWCTAVSTKNPSEKESLPTELKFTLEYQYKITDSELTHKTDPINDLWSATQYACQVRAVNGAGLGKIQSGTFWTKAEPVTVPVGSQVNYDPDRSNDSSVYVTLPEIPSPNVEIERYQILVKRIAQNEGSTRRKRSVDRGLTFEEAGDLGADNYTAAEWNDSRDSFRVGDGRNYSDYYNAPLEKGETYDILYRAASVVGEDVEYTEYISLSSHVKVGHYPPLFPVGIVAGSAAGAIFFLLILAAVIVVLVVLSRKGMLPSMPPRARSDSNANIIDGTELAPVVVVEDRVDSPLPNGEVHTDTPQVAVPRYERHFQPYTLDGFMTTIRGLTKQPRGFTQEYQALPNHAGHYPQSVAKIQENRRKNRYQDIIPYDHNRIVLSGDDCDDDISNYINASYVTDYKGRRTYIASQGPKTGITVDDFWQMIWQEDVRVIVMATDCFERGREKCAEYWPTKVGASLIHGNYEVEHQSTTEVNENVKKRQFVISKDGTQRTITQFQYVGWPDHGVPALCAPILKLRATVREAIEPDTVTLVHCSAGVGRTGTFMAVDDCLSEYNDTKKFNIKETLTRFRHFRERTVQTDRQYAYVYHCLLEALALPDTDVPKHEFIDRVNKHGISEREFEILEIFRGLDMGEECQGRLEENIHKNRFPDIIPDDYNRAALTKQMAGRNLYLNACYMDNLSHSPSLLATQMTLEHTILELWRLVRDYSITLFVRMDGDHVDDPNERYWPLKGSMSVPPFTIEFKNRENLHKDYSLETFAVTFENNTWNVRMLVFHGWPGSALTLPPLQAMINLYQALKQQQGESRQAVIVQCFNGATKSGLLGATYSLLDTLQVQDTISVFKATRIIHTTRPQFIPDMEHYSFLHSVVCHVLRPSQEEEESIYENQLPAAEFADDEDLYENVPRKPLPRES